ncbi:transmembrane protein, putative (macronuclear) [Tetrahymena thermophila SB210]|uniref:Transmembrane protein, putative n=1 Tax=Tetrahymena thermophila (strain SB210) TaxID=312017 RepID=W7XJZ1_TETTS|nr:transmembrane protein, putative [Tetrahymena thermophila SB210]EWS74449.1 transmembrane protein, putative [Tetrahymena thermophila SB210]|eukprot:XP_012653026.1 transmembrane protein, putative [Tetrahymena thermophila SB210]
MLCFKQIIQFYKKYDTLKKLIYLKHIRIQCEIKQSQIIFGERQFLLSNQKVNFLMILKENKLISFDKEKILMALLYNQLKNYDCNSLSLNLQIERFDKNQDKQMWLNNLIAIIITIILLDAEYKMIKQKFNV